LEQSDAMSEIAKGKQARLPWRQRRLRLALAILFAGGVLFIWGSWLWWSDRSYRNAIMQIELEMANGRFGTAARSLTKLLEQEPDSGEAAVLLARCEQERGRPEAAARALARVAPGSVFSHKAILARMRLAHDSGQFAAAEQIVNAAAEDPRNDRSHARFLLAPIFSQLGRLDEAERLIEERWEHLNETGEGASEPAIDLVRMHIELTFKPNPVENVRAYLDQAANLAADDDRIWLGRANLAIRTGAYGEAERWLDACLKSRPDDVPVWSARLSWGIATNRIDVVQQALKHLPAGDSTSALVHRLEAWLAAKRGDVATERRDLERLLTEDPADLRALDRLAQLMEKAGQPAQAAELARKKAEINRLLARYEKLYDRNQPIRDSEEMASLAEQLGREFEARVFLTVAISDEPERDDLRQSLRRLMSQRSKTVALRGQTLAEVIANEQGDAGNNRLKPSL
jgi:thioredoxin-like negative regulator of GroEL